MIMTVVALFRGYCLKLYCWVFYPKVQIGRRVRVWVWPRIAGPGKIMIGDKVCFVDNYGHRAHLVTCTSEALISIGAQSAIGGTKFCCSQRIEIGPNALLGLATIMDTPQLPLGANAKMLGYTSPAPAPVKVGRNVWIATHAIIHGGVTIDDHTAVGAGSVVYASEDPARGRVIGNPARAIVGSI